MMPTVITNWQPVVVFSLLLLFRDGVVSFQGYSSLSSHRLLTAPNNIHHHAKKKKKRFSRNNNAVLLTSNDIPHFVFPGGGIFFYWQAGVVTYMRDQGIYKNNDNNIQFTGASAGALTATLTCGNVDFRKAMDLALEQAADAGVWDRSGGLQGIWGYLVRIWLDQLLPDDIIKRINLNNIVGEQTSPSSNKNNNALQKKARLTLLVTEFPSFRKRQIDSFQSRNDLIDCNLASVHLPWFMDGKFVSNFRGRAHLDGSFLAQPQDYGISQNSQSKNVILFDFKQDPRITENFQLLDFIKTMSEDTVREIFEIGWQYGKVMDDRGDFNILLPQKQENDTV